MSKYDTLVNVLDQLRQEAPSDYAKYRPIPTDIEKVNQARSRALIHLFLKVKFGLLGFDDREKYITDGTDDGGVDAYFIDQENHKVYVVQAKFRTNAKNYENKHILLEELLKIDLDRMTDGEITDESGSEYNGKIKQFIRELSTIKDIGRYTYEVIILANLSDTKPSAIKKLTGGFSGEIYDYEKVYDGLVFPVVTGTFYNNSQLYISLNLDNKTSSSARITYNVETEFKNCDITVVFVPTEEIGRILYKYKNSILTFNPRCYLELRSNSVNKDIYETILTKASNEFALFNNGLTMLSDNTSVSEHIGKKGKAQIVIENPQIINGGQTAFTLSRIYEEIVMGKLSKDTFNNKEVLLKIITFEKSANEDEGRKLELIESISKATNSQSQVSDSDRRSNDRIQVQLQRLLFSKYGVYYERKKGEFADGIKDKYISRAQVIDREVFLRIAMACDGYPSQARRSSSRAIFQEDHFNKFLNDEARVTEYYYAYLIHQHLGALERHHSSDLKDPFGTSGYGHALRYGKYAVTFASIQAYFKNENSLRHIEKHVMQALKLWLKFEEFATDLPANSGYFKSYIHHETGAEIRDYNYDGYYKGRTINNDIATYFEAERVLEEMMQ